MAQLVKNPPVMWETWVRSLGWEDSLEKGKAIPTPGFWPGESHVDSTVHGIEKSRTRLSDLHFHFLSSSPTVCRSLNPYDCLQLLSAFFSSLSCLLDNSWCFSDNFSSFFYGTYPAYSS